MNDNNNTPPVTQQPPTQSGSQAASSPMQSQKNNGDESKKMNLKNIAAVVVLTLFLVVAMAGVFIAQRQQDTEGPVAPNVPSSQPSAAREMTAEEQLNCTLNFTVAAPDGTAVCESKTLADSYISEGGTELDPGTALEPGTQYAYAITVSADDETAGSILVTDTLPSQVEFVRGKVSVPGSSDPDPTVAVTYDQATREVRANLGAMTAGSTYLVEILFTVTTELAVTDYGTFTNTAQVVTNQSSVGPDTCSVDAQVLASGTARCTDKAAYTDFRSVSTAQAIAEDSSLNPGDEFVYRISVDADEPTSGTVTVMDELPTAVEFVSTNLDSSQYTYDSSTRMFTADLGQLAGGANNTEYVEIKVRVVEETSVTTFINEAEVVTAEDTANANICTFALNVEQPSASPSPTPSPSPSPGVTPTPSPSPTPGVTPSPTLGVTPSPTPTTTTTSIGCNDLCQTNADCSNTSHICYTTDDGTNRCRLAENVQSDTCTAPVAQQTTQQPDLPEELPETGPEDWARWLQAGLVTLGIGAALLLLL